MPLVDAPLNKTNKIADTNWIELLHPSLEQYISLIKNPDKFNLPYETYEQFRYCFLERISKFSELISQYFIFDNISFHQLTSAIKCEQNSWIFKKLYGDLLEYQKQINLIDLSHLNFSKSDSLNIENIELTSIDVIFNDISKKIPLIHKLAEIIKSPNNEDLAAVDLAVFQHSVVSLTLKFHKKINNIIQLSARALKTAVSKDELDDYTDAVPYVDGYPYLYDDLLGFVEDSCIREALKLIGESFRCQ